jgi:molybdopterin-binding protein
MRACTMMLAMLAIMGPAGAETVQLYAAGSLRGALAEAASKTAYAIIKATSVMVGVD